MLLSYVYILKCSDGSYYTGVTTDIKKRLKEHQNGIHKSSYTFNRRPVHLVFYSTFTDINMAIEREKQVKKWSKVKKEVLIRSEYNLLPYLSKKKFQ
nr:GIY-YIG nuclease family protein [Allomuricauda sp.]